MGKGSAEEKRRGGVGPSHSKGSVPETQEERVEAGAELSLARTLTCTRDKKYGWERGAKERDGEERRAGRMLKGNGNSTTEKPAKGRTRESASEVVEERVEAEAELSLARMLTQMRDKKYGRERGAKERQDGSRVLTTKACSHSAL